MPGRDRFRVVHTCYPTAVCDALATCDDLQRVPSITPQNTTSEQTETSEQGAMASGATGVRTCHKTDFGREVHTWV
ncbi:hypothetical protein ABIA38_008788 [Embleya sp. AB8]